MSLLAETMFDSRKTLWDDLGQKVTGAVSSKQALELSGLDWRVEQREIYTSDGIKIPKAYANIRTSDYKPLGVVGERYQVVQNTDAFEFTDALLGEGVKYETAGSLKEGKIIWLLAKLPNQYKILGENIDPFVLFCNHHDGTGAIKVVMTPVRVYCLNTLNLSLRTAKRTWSGRHTTNITSKLDEARETLALANSYMDALNNQFEDLYSIKLNKDKVIKLVDTLLPTDNSMSDRQKGNIDTIKTDILFRYEEAPDLKDREETGARFMQSILDSTSHKEPARLTQNYQMNHFASMINGNELADRAMNLVMAAA